MSNQIKRMKEQSFERYVAQLARAVDQQQVALCVLECYWGQVPTELAAFLQPYMSQRFPGVQACLDGIPEVVQNFKLGLPWDHKEAPADATGDVTAEPNYAAMTLAPSLSAGAMEPSNEQTSED